jgi:hypothetical protein
MREKTGDIRVSGIGLTGVISNKFLQLARGSKSRNNFLLCSALLSNIFPKTPK